MRRDSSGAGIVQRGNIGRKREERRVIGPASGIIVLVCMRECGENETSECHYSVLCVSEARGACCTVIVHATSDDVVVVCIRGREGRNGGRIPERYPRGGSGEEGLRPQEGGGRCGILTASMRRIRRAVMRPWP